jgi:hypothetical protein
MLIHHVTIFITKLKFIKTSVKCFNSKFLAFPLHHYGYIIQDDTNS